MIPHEVSLGEVFVPPMLLVSALALLLAFATVLLLNRFRLSRYFVAPSLVFLALATIYAVALGAFVIPM